MVGKKTTNYGARIREISQKKTAINTLYYTTSAQTLPNNIVNLTMS